MYNLRRFGNVSHSSFYIEMSEFLLIIVHGNHILTPNTPSSHHPGKESRGNLIDFYNQVYVTKLEPFAKQFQLLPGVSRCAQNWVEPLQSLTLFGGFSDMCVCCCQVETPPLSPYPQQLKPGFLKQRLSSLVYVSPYNGDTPPPRSPAVSYTFNSSTSEVCEHPTGVMF